MFRSLPKLAVLAAILPAVILPATASASADYYLTLDGVAGETRAAGGHSGQIEIASWSFGASNPTSAGSSGMSAGKVSYSDLSVMISLEKAPLGLKAGTKIPVVEVRKSGDDKRQDYLVVTLEEVMVSSFQKLDDGNARLSINYARVAFPAGTGKTMAAEVIA
jgi:type VI protein secretion system component Hcp